jgi:hypothetical protein
MERVTIRSKARPFTSNGDSIEPDSAILSVIRGNGSDDHRQVKKKSYFDSMSKFDFFPPLF